MNKLLLLTFIFFSFACEKPEEETPIFEDNLNNSSFSNNSNIENKKIKYIWKESSLPLKVKFDHEYLGKDKHVIRDAFDSWNQAAGKELLKFGGLLKNQQYSKTADYYLKDSKSFGIYVSNIKTDNISSQTLAITQVIAEKNGSTETHEIYEIIHADIILNEYNFDFSTNQEALPSHQSIAHS